MSNEVQNLAKVKEKIKTLNSELSGLLSEQKQLEEEIAKIERNTNGTVREKLIAEWVDQQSPNFDITFSLNSAFSKEDYTIHAKRNDYGYKFSELFFVRDTMSDPEVKIFLNEITNSLNLIDELVAQKTYESFHVENFYGKDVFIERISVVRDYNSQKLYVYIYMDEADMPRNSSLCVRLNKISNDLVQARVFYDTTDAQKFEIQLNDNTSFITGTANDSSMEKYPFTLTSKQTIPFNNMVPEIKKLVDNLKSEKAKYIKPVK